MEQFEIYDNTDRIIRNEAKKLEESHINTTNKQILKDYKIHLRSLKISEKRIYKLSLELRIMMQAHPNIILSKITKKEATKLIAWVYNLKRSFHTQWDYIRCLKQFYHYYEEEDPRLKSKDETEREEALSFYKYLFKTVKKPVGKDNNRHSDIITEKECNHIITKGCQRMRDKALIAFLHETGCRAGELLTMRINSLRFEGRRNQVELNGKTGKRTIPIAKSVVLLQQYIERHPHNDNRNAMLWISYNPKNLHKPLKHIGLLRLIYRVRERAGMQDKRFNPHWFRHSRATLLGAKLPENMLCAFMGWRQGSKMVRTYCHHSEEQLLNEYYALHGLEDAKQKEDKIKSCGVCSTVNHPSSLYCSKCGNPLSVEIAMKDQETVKTEMDKSIKRLMEVMQDPVLFAKFQEFKKNTI